MDFALSDLEFSRFQRFIHEVAGIQMSSAKKPLVSSRLMGRLRARSMRSFDEYFHLITGGTDPQEKQTAVDLLTTNETYFFREPRHFEFLKQLVARRPPARQPFRVWSAASSSGEEAYSIAMLLADLLGDQPWEVFGSDLSTRVLERARAGLFPMERAANVPPEFLRRFCLKGIGAHEGMLLVSSVLRSRVRFSQINLTEPLPDVGMFDVILLRNVMIYFNNATKRAVVDRLLGTLVPEGHLLIGHSESLHGIHDGLETVAPAIYRRPSAR